MWWTQAERDIGAAQLLRANEYWETCALMCQQAAEKALKALWIDIRHSEPPKTHWVERLASDLGAPASVVDAAERLSADYTASRYPGPGFMPMPMYDGEDATSRIADANTIVTWAAKHWEDDNGN